MKEKSGKESLKNKEKRRARPQNMRPTIGFLAGNVWSRTSLYPTMIWTGVADAARERDANLICFAGGSLGESPFTEFDAQRNVLYDLVTSDNVDGLVISSGALSLFVSAEEIQDFCDRYRPLPMVSVAVALEGIPSVLVDNVTGLRDAISHLIETHGYRRIAFIRGPEDHQEANARYGAYAEALAAHGLALNPDLVASGDFSRPSGAAAMRLLLDEQKLRPGVDFEAVVAATDAMALGVPDVLQARGIRVPYDVAVVGFDDVAEARVATPSLTTVRQPIHEQGKRAVEMLLALLAGEEVPEQVTLPTEMVVRQSCGCHSQAVLQAAAEPVAGAETPRDRSAVATLEEALVSRREEILAAMVQAVASYAAEAAPAMTAEWAGQVLDGFAAAMGDESPAGFLSTLDRGLRQVAAGGGDPSTSSSAGSPHGSGQSVTAWQGALSALRRHVLPCLSDDEALSRAENLWQQARLFIAEAAQQAQRYRELQAEQQTGVLQEIGQAMITTSDVAGLMDVIARELPRLGIPSTYLSLYEGQVPPPQESRLILAYDENGRVELEAGGLRFPSRTLAPEGTLPQARRYSMVVEPLYFREHQLGLALFEVGPRDGAVYEVLGEQVSSALQAALLTQQVRRRALQLQTAVEVSSAASGVLDPSELIQQVVDLARERFDLYYAGLFLVDRTGDWTGEAGRWAVLRAGTGEAGRRLLEQGHKLEVGGESMIGWCIANQQAHITLDVGEEAARLVNPLLPETRSELALPLVSRGETIGALTIQSSQEAAFTEEDLTVLQTMADQLANAIANARLYDALAHERDLLHALMDNIPDTIYFKDVASRFTRINRAQAQILGVDPEAAIGKTDLDFFTPEHAQDAYANEQEIVKSGQPLIGKVERIRRADGQFIWVSVTKVPIKDKEGQVTGTVGISRDITERKAAEEKIEHLNLVLRAIRNVNQLITRERDRGRLLQGACETLIETRGYHNAWIALLDESEGHVTTAEAGLGQDFSPLVERLKRGELTDCGQRALKQSGVVVTKDPFSTCADCPLSSMYDGRGAMTVLLKYGGKVYGLLSVSIPRDLAADEEERALFEEVAGDIAFALHSAEQEEERKRAEEALAWERNLLRALMDTVPDHIYFKDTESRFIRISKALAEWLGLSDPAQAVGKTDFDFFTEEHARPAYEDEQRIVRTGQPLVGIEERETWPDRPDTWVLTSKVPLRDEGGKIVGTFGISRDITDRKRAEEALKEYSERLEEMVEERTQELREAQEQLIRKEKLAVLGQLAGGVGHELRNPLGAISNAVYFLNMALEEPDPEVKETLEILQKEVKTSEMIISSLLDFARTKPPTRRKVDVNDVVQEALSRTTVPENVEVVSQPDGTLPIILADPDQLGQVFGNIILNAIQAMPEGGQLVVKSDAPSPEWVAVSFADTGMGISEESLGKLFEPLFTTRAKGIGLGLAVTKTLVQGHGGTIEVESEVGVGTTFTVRLPISVG